MATLARSSRLLFNIYASNIARSNLLRLANTTNVRYFHRVTPLLADLRYSDKHEWVSVDGNIGTIGISNYAQEALGDIVYAQLPEIDAEIDQEDEIGVLESVKAASELYTPVSGKVTDVNTEVEEKPALINQSPYDKGWLFKVELTKPEEIDGLMSEDDYNTFLKEQEE